MLWHNVWRPAPPFFLLLQPFTFKNMLENYFVSNLLSSCLSLLFLLLGRCHPRRVFIVLCLSLCLSRLESSFVSFICLLCCPVSHVLSHVTLDISCLILAKYLARSCSNSTLDSLKKKFSVDWNMEYGGMEAVGRPGPSTSVICFTR